MPERKHGKTDYERQLQRRQLPSVFTGSAFKYFLLEIALYLGTVFSLGIAYPFLTCNLYRWEVNNTVINGKRQYFNGKGSDLFKNYLKWWLLTIVTLSVYKLWLTRNVMVWKIRHTHFQAGTGESNYRCAINEKALMLVKYYAIIICTLSIGMPVAMCYKKRWTLQHTAIDGNRLDFNATAKQCYGFLAVTVLLILITLGVFVIFAPVRVTRWETEHTFINKKYSAIAL